MKKKTKLFVLTIATVLLSTNLANTSHPNMAYNNSHFAIAYLAYMAQK